MKNKPGKREYSKKINRLAIIESARALFIEKKYSSITMNVIASTAGISKKTLYTYFPSKLALYVHVFEEYLQELHDELISAANRDLPAKEAIIETFRAIFEFTKRNRKFMLMFWQMNSDDTSDNAPAELVARVRVWNKAMLDNSVRGIKRAQAEGYLAGYDPHLLVHAISAINKGLFIHSNKENILEVADIDPDSLFEVFASLIFKK